MTDNPQTDDPIGETTPETARALLWRHGLPEDVIDGALCLHAQELAAVQRGEADDLHQTEPGVVKGLRIGADLIDPTTSHDSAVLPAVPVPPTTHAGDRAAKAESLLLHFTAEAHRRKWDYDRGLDDDGVPIKSEAFGALHRLGEDMRKALEELRRMAAEARQQEPTLAAHHAAVPAGAACKCPGDCGHRPGAEAQQQPDTALAHPPHHRWYVETRDGLADEWAPGMRFTTQPAAATRLRDLNEHHPRWADGAAVQRRIVRETTTYTVEQPVPGPGRVADEEQGETRQACACGQDGCEYCDVAEEPGS